MKGIRRIICILLAVMMVAGMLPAQTVAAGADTEIVAEGTCGNNFVDDYGDNLRWVLDKNGTLTISGTGGMGDYSNTSPWYYDGTSITSIVIEPGVTSIGKRAFECCKNATKITIPDSVTSIGYAAFSQCTSLTEITIPDSVTNIGDKAFQSCTNLMEITIPKGVSNIGERTFEDCTSLTNITIPDSVTNIGGYAFYYCTSLKEITIPSSVTNIGNYAFYYCASLTNITVPEGATNIGYSAFHNCISLERVTILSSVTSIGNAVFCNCYRLTEITIPNSVISIDSVAFSACDALSDIYYSGTSEEWTAIDDVCPEADYVHYSCVSGDNHWSKVNTATCTEAGSSYETCDCGYKRNVVETEAFGHSYGTDFVCTVCGDIDCIDKGSCGENITWVLYKNGELVISGTGDMANYNYDSPWYDYRSDILSVVINEGVTSIGSYAFYDCNSFTKITIPASVTDIGEYAFGTVIVGVREADVYITDPSVWCKTAFGVASNPMYLNEGTLYILDALGNEITEIALDDSVTTIPDYAFKGSNLTQIAIPANVTNIGLSAFEGCSSLTEIVIPNSVTTIDALAFRYCSSLAEINIPGSVTKIGSMAFCGCSNLLRFNVEENNENYSSDEYGVLFNKNKTELVFCPAGFFGDYSIPDSVSTIGYDAFRDCGRLMSITISDSVTAICDGAFYGCSALTEVTIPESVTSIGGQAFGECRSLKNITIPEGITNIFATFVECISLEKIVIPEGVSSIEFAFRNCSNLKEITIPGSVTYIGGEDFKNCSSLTDIYYGGTVEEWTALGSYRPNADYVHYSCVSSDNHWRKTSDATCTEAGATYDGCDCGYKKNVVDIAALGHDMSDWETITEAAPDSEGEERSDCSRCDYYETRSIQFVDNMLKLEGEEFNDKTTVYINGLPYPIVVRGDERYVELPTEEDCSIVTYTYHIGDPNDVHTQYPVGMKVYMVSDGKITYVKELDNLLQYSGSSIRITGKKGIRMITSLYKDTKSALTGNGLAGYTLVEYGTVLCFAHELGEDGDLVLGKSYSRSNYAYKRGVADPVFANSGNLTQYTNVLVGFNLDQCKEDIVMRPYIILEDANGEQHTIYGGTIYRSIAYVAYQNRNAVNPGSAAYSFVWDIIHYVYGNKYDSDYKG